MAHLEVKGTCPQSLPSYGRKVREYQESLEKCVWTPARKIELLTGTMWMDTSWIGSPSLSWLLTHPQTMPRQVNDCEKKFFKSAFHASNKRSTLV